MGLNDQRNNPFTEPEREKLIALGRKHVLGMEFTDAEQVWISSGMEHLLLHTVGRRSGRAHKVALPFWVDGDGHRVVVASFVGAPQHPAWYWNLTDADANGKVLVKLRTGEVWVRPEILDGAEYRELWAALTADREFYRDYQSRTERRIPLVRLREL
ncbi:nitroreductase family deazaflavin-dependent oxidoreductase [Nocardia sp. 2]|uniref:Nitroreductase family deazaflavin-dependent oxidoreductase n=1 Tax=Nocardia acididurans TaxID=2802282 RepID=A0ABS1MEB6_9NOCA|nr:nitroreductase/quinone reductase family protein [Nocardia acididurans]MBL1077528.1 nitroreductase family deazaflavin-dependent oxidoreductase [Nocardia acididurans]